ncbi:MAG: triose-phosphate isomerase [Bacteroidota bacterium]|nr:triose-phosphate isomerase [Bacteroidota bacterium]
MRKKIIAGNWKMHKRIDEGAVLINSIAKSLEKEDLSNKKIILFPPATLLSKAAEIAKTAQNISVGAQNCHFESEGAFTGEISAAMLADVGTEYVLAGHSERREYFSEDDSILAKKTTAILREGMIPIYCCGEKLEEREAGKHFDIIRKQISEGLFHLSADEITRTIIAYEPVWAIGTGLTASPDQAQEIHAFIRKLVAEKFGERTAQEVPILYGGSVKGSNAKALFTQPDIDGGLVGGASLKAEDFLEIIQAA